MEGERTTQSSDQGEENQTNVDREGVKRGRDDKENMKEKKDEGEGDGVVLCYTILTTGQGLTLRSGDRARCSGNKWAPAGGRAIINRGDIPEP